MSVFIFLINNDNFIFKRGEIDMITYKPFRHYMVEHDIDRQYLIDVVEIGSTTISKINSDKPIRLDIIEKICLHFDIRIDQFMEIKKDH